MAESSVSPPPLVTTIYCLKDPTGAIRYVGKTSRPLSQRLASHCEHGKRKSKRTRRVCCWISSLLQKGERPTIEALEITTEKDWPERERYWIAEMRRRGYDLTNHSEGGRGGRAGVHLAFSDEHRAKIAAAAQGRKLDPATVEKSVESRKRAREAKIARGEAIPWEVEIPCGWCGKTISRPRKNLKTSKTGHLFCSHSCSAYWRAAHEQRPPFTPEQRRKISERLRGQTRSEETRRKMSEAQKGKRKPYSPEMLAKRRTPEARAARSKAVKAAKDRKRDPSALPAWITVPCAHCGATVTRRTCYIRRKGVPPRSPSGERILPDYLFCSRRCARCWQLANKAQ